MRRSAATMTSCGVLFKAERKYGVQSSNIRARAVVRSKSRLPRATIAVGVGALRALVLTGGRIPEGASLELVIGRISMAAFRDTQAPWACPELQVPGLRT